MSWVWQFFVKIDNTTARCIICERVYSYYSTIHNLKKHLYKKHPTPAHTEGEQSQSQSTDDDEAEPSEKKPKIMLCPHTGEHVADPHCSSDDDSKLPETSEAEGDEQCKEAGRARRKSTSWIWEHFTRINTIRAECRLCGGKYTYESTISNLRKHLARRHPHVVPLRDKSRQSSPTTFQPETEAEEEAERGPRSSWIWQFFNTIDSSHSTCRLCSRKYSYESSSTNLKRHLERMHPEDVPERPKRPSYKVPASRPSVSEEPNSKEQEQFTEVFIASPDSTESDGAEAPSPPPLRGRTDDALEQFGRYVAVLMSRLPEHVANSMQAEFITKIMQAQTEHDKARASKTTRRQNGVNGNTENTRCPLADVILEATDS